MVDSSLCKLVAVLRRRVCSLSLWRDVGGALCATKVHKIVGMAAPNATFFVWWAKYFEWGWGGGWCANGTPYYIK